MTVRLAAIALVAAFVVHPAFAAKKEKKAAPPPVGEVKIGDWTCYRPPDFSNLNETQRRAERDKGYDFAWKLINGTSRTDFKVDEQSDIDTFETAFLGRPVLLYTWLPENFERCKAVAEGKEAAASYKTWLANIGRELERNECRKPLSYEVHAFLDVQSEWQMRYHVCKGDKIRVEATGADNGQYTIEDKGKGKSKYITVAGDPDKPEAGELGLVPEMPAGALVMRWEAEDASLTRYTLVGPRLEWEAPDHGFITFAVNDTTYFDNQFREERGAKDYVSVDIYPTREAGSSMGPL
jgi:hypothetical protein